MWLGGGGESLKRGMWGRERLNVLKTISAIENSRAGDLHILDPRPRSCVSKAEVARLVLSSINFTKKSKTTTLLIMTDRIHPAEAGNNTIDSMFVAAPGTEILMDEDKSGVTEERLHRLQHAKTGDGHILLVPQPSLTDPNDPLRWSTSKKWLVLMNGVGYAFKLVLYLDSKSVC